MTNFKSDVVFEDILNAAGVELDSKGLYLAKPYRNCQSMAACFGAVRMALSAKDKEIMRLHDEKAELADRCSKEATKNSKMAEQKSDLQMTAVRRGLESIPDLTPETRDRLLSVSG